MFLFHVENQSSKTHLGTTCTFNLSLNTIRNLIW
jgi:hypothetical protein